MEILVTYANDFWNLWLALMFIGILTYALWPTKKRGAEMEHAANIPLMDDEPLDAPHTTKGA